MCLSLDALWLRLTNDDDRERLLHFVSVFLGRRQKERSAS